MGGLGGDGRATWGEVLRGLVGRGIEPPAARWMCETASGHDGAEFAEITSMPVPDRLRERIESMTARLEGGEPLQYVLGRWGFRRLDLFVDGRVLIPRPDTEPVVDIVRGHIAGLGVPATVADLGTGSGAIGLAVLDESPPGSVTVWMTDESPAALDVARANAAGVGRAAAGARFAQGDWYAALDPALRGTLDVIVSNPPYIAVGDPELDDSVARWEPSGALLAGPDGLDDIRTLLAGATEWLRPGGMFVTEIGHTQAAAVSALATGAGLTRVTVHPDLAGRDRFVSGLRE